MLTQKQLDFAAEARGFMPQAEGQALAEAAASVDVTMGPLLEVGSYCGKSACYLGPVAQLLGSVLFCVDHHRGSEENQPGWMHHEPDLVDAETGLLNTLPLFQKTISAAGLTDAVVPIVGESSLVACFWAKPLSFLFIDGGHGEAPTKSDYVSWFPHVAVGGLVAIHDVFVDPAQGGQAPHDNIYAPALASGLFEETMHVGSLRVLKRL